VSVYLVKAKLIIRWWKTIYHLDLLSKNKKQLTEWLEEGLKDKLKILQLKEDYLIIKK